MGYVARRYGLLALLSAWTFWVHTAAACPKVLCINDENQVRLESTVIGCCDAEGTEASVDSAVEDQSKCGDCADFVLELAGVGHRQDIQPSVETDSQSYISPSDIIAPSHAIRGDLGLPLPLFQQRLGGHYPQLMRPYPLPLIC